jgi:Histidine kinase
VPGKSKRRRIYWACQIGGWFLSAQLALLFLTGGDDEPRAWQLAISMNASAASAILWTHVYRAAIRKRGWAGLSPGRLLPRVSLGSVLVGTAITFTSGPVWLLVLGDRGASVSEWAPPAIMNWSSLALGWSVVYFGVHYFERWRQAELENLQLAVAAAEARLHGLMSQLNPHFLFNCLNSVRALIVEDPSKAQTTVTELSNLMRYSMQAGRVVTVPLETEIEMVRTYLSLEGVRLDERLASEIDMAPDTRSVPVPTMLVQLLVENGVKHGIERLPDGGAIRVVSRLVGGALRLSVTSSGRLVAQAGSTRVGLANARERLRLLYGERAGLTLREESGSVVAELTLPGEQA